MTIRPPGRTIFDEIMETAICIHRKFRARL
jgi:hypothetical protein